MEEPTAVILSSWLCPHCAETWLLEFDEGDVIAPVDLVCECGHSEAIYPPV